ncbi:MAG TPA: hypothetical protein VFU15_15775 [Bacteroidia bacterium]|nr:hypothetical protein [Bacteroidia bacterium]
MVKTLWNDFCTFISENFAKVRIIPVSEIRETQFLKNKKTYRHETFRDYQFFRPYRAFICLLPGDEIHEGAERQR